MRYRYVHYNLENGFIHNWLVAGPHTIPIQIEQFPADDFRKQIAQHFYDPTSGIKKTPVERGPLDKGLFQVGDYAGSWNYYACHEDHLVDHSRVYTRPHYLRSWAYTQLSSKVAQEVQFVLTSFGPVDIWLNGQHVHHQQHFADWQTYSSSFKVSLVKGNNKIIVRFEGIAINEGLQAMALQVCKVSNEQRINHLEPYPAKVGTHVTIPTLIQTITRRNTFERVSATAYLLQDVYEGETPIYLHWPADLEVSSYTTVRLIAASGQFYAEADVDGIPGDKVFLGYPLQVPEGPFRIMMMPRPWEFYEKNTRITREIPLWNLSKHRYSSSPYGTYAERRQEALVSAASASGTPLTSLYAEIAKMVLNQWKAVNKEYILQQIQYATLPDLVGMLGMMYRYKDHTMFPKDLVQPLEECVQNYPYSNNRIASLETDHSEGQEILSRTCELLAGQLYPESIFAYSGKTGQWHRKNGERLAMEWLHQRGATGFTDWDSSLSFSKVLIALSHLVDLAETESIWEMASVLMDKLFLTLAINSYQGVFGSTHSRTHSSFVKGGLLEPTSGITRLMWGTGIFNHHFAAPVSLACMENYELPGIISGIAVAMPDEMWSRECHGAGAGWVVNKVTYKSPDFMLCSAQDYFPGEKGRLEHIWQSTLGPAATVFVTHPACMSEDDARQPNFWAGNVILPRVAQWKDVLIGVYQLPEDDWMGFTHAYFPIFAFDEYIIRDGWAFARKGEGYLALKASRGIDLIQRGLYAFRELRSYGRENAWLCHMGRKVLDGDFNTFQDKVVTLPAKFEEQSISCTTLRGETLSFGWQGPFLRNGLVQPLSGFEHYENIYVTARHPSSQMDIQLGEDILRLDFGKAPKYGLGQ